MKLSDTGEVQLEVSTINWLLNIVITAADDRTTVSRFLSCFVSWQLPFTIVLAGFVRSASTAIRLPSVPPANDVGSTNSVVRVRNTVVGSLLDLQTSTHVDSSL